MRQNDLYRAAHNIKPDAHMKGRLAVRVTPEPEPRVWVRTVGTVVATCMIAVMVIGGVWAWNIHGGEPGGVSPNEGNLIVPGSNGTDAIPGGSDVSEEPSAEPADYGEWRYHRRDRVEFIWPLESSHTIAKGFGARRNPVDGTLDNHQGIDIAAEVGEPVLAVATGTIAEIGFNEEDGNYIYLEHESLSKTTIYAQLDSCAEGLQSGDIVQQGDIIGYAGATGNATDPHLHFGVYGQYQPRENMTAGEGFFNPGSFSSELADYFSIMENYNESNPDTWFTLTWPLAAELPHRVIKPSGMIARPYDGEYDKHEGVDIAAEEGDPVLATVPGIVTETGFDEEFGNYIYIDHEENLRQMYGDNIISFYAHLSDFAEGLEEGSFVEQGDIIGYVGATGNAETPHLHWGVSWGGDGTWMPVEKTFPESDYFCEIDQDLRDSLVPLPPETEGAFLGARFLGYDENGEYFMISGLALELYGQRMNQDPNNAIVLTSITYNGVALDTTFIYDGNWHHRWYVNSDSEELAPSAVPVTHTSVKWRNEAFREPGEYVFRGTYRNEPFECSATIE